MVRCVALLSGGLDSMLAIRLMQEQDIEVEALNFKTMFTCCQDVSGQAARDLGVRLTVLGTDDDYLDLVKRPQFGYGKGANPCIDCRIYMFELAAKFMEQVDAQFLVSGEVVGQRPKSQKKRDLGIIAHHAGTPDLLLRPLSAKCLPITKPEREGWVDREKLYGIVGRGRKPLIQLAHELGIQEIPSPSTGCALTEPKFSKKVFDLIQIEDSTNTADFELLRIGRHFRIDDQVKVIVGRNEQDNQTLLYYFQSQQSSAQAILEPDGFPGPVVMITGSEAAKYIETAGQLLMEYSQAELRTGAVFLSTRTSRTAINVEAAVETIDARLVTA